MLYQLNNREVDVDLYQIRHDGKVLAVEPKVFDLIVYLLEHRERIISRAELFEHVWEGRTVSDTSLSNHIKSARKVLGDNGELQCVIKTVRSRGYQFIAATQCLACNDNLSEQADRANSNVISNSRSKPFNSSPVTIIEKQSYFNVKALFLTLFVLLFFIIIILMNISKEDNVADGYLLVVPFSIASNQSENWQAFSDQMTR